MLLSCFILSPKKKSSIKVIPRNYVVHCMHYECNLGDVQEAIHPRQD